MDAKQLDNLIEFTMTIKKEMCIALLKKLPNALLAKMGTKHEKLQQMVISIMQEIKK